MADQGSRVETRMLPSVVEDATYGCPALNSCFESCKRSASILISQVACAKGHRGAGQFNFDIFVRQECTVIVHWCLSSSTFRGAREEMIH
jgi:hypothetical protein